MPCDCSHLKPRFHEVESKKVAELIVYVIGKINGEVEPWIKEASEYMYGKEDAVHQLTEILCGICMAMNENTKEKIIYNSRDRISRKLADWWEDHEIIDNRKGNKS